MKPCQPEMIESFNVPNSQVASWVGITSASFALAQSLTGLFMGQASDRLGRKPLILLGVSCTMLATLLFGFAQSLPWAITARAFGGAGAGAIGIIRTTIAEMVPERELQPRAFSIMPLVWSTGSIIGPIVGGTLAKPATNFPSLFGDSWYLRRFPFALPNLAACVLYVIGISTAILFLKETLETRKGKRDYGRVLGRLLITCCGRRKGSREDDDEGDPLLANGSKKKPDEPPPKYREVFTYQSSINLLAYTLLAFHTLAFDQLVPVFLHMPVADHLADVQAANPFRFVTGFGLGSGQIGVLFTAYGLSTMLIQFVVFPPVARRCGVLACLRACTLVFPVVYLLTPFAARVPTDGGRQAAVFACMLLKGAAGVFAFPCTTILLTNSARSLRLLGTLNGVATSISAVGRAAGPFVSGAVFTLGIRLGWLILPWWMLAAWAALAHVPTWWIVESEGFGADRDEGEAGSSGETTAAPSPAEPDEEAVLEEEGDEVSETTPLVRGREGRLSKTRSNSSGRRRARPLPRRVSGPHRMGAPSGRTLSSRLGQAQSMHGGGRPYH